MTTEERRDSLSGGTVQVKLGRSGRAAKRLDELEAEYAEEFQRRYEEHKEREREAEEKLQHFLITY